MGFCVFHIAGVICVTFVVGSDVQLDIWACRMGGGLSCTCIGHIAASLKDWHDAGHGPQLYYTLPSDFLQHCMNISLIAHYTFNGPDHLADLNIPPPLFFFLLLYILGMC